MSSMTLADWQKTVSSTGQPSHRSISRLAWLSASSRASSTESLGSATLSYPWALYDACQRPSASSLVVMTMVQSLYCSSDVVTGSWDMVMGSLRSRGAGRLPGCLLQVGK